MLEISYFGQKIEIRENGEQIYKASKIESLAKYLNQQKPEKVESHILGSDAMIFNIDHLDQIDLEELLLSGFNEEHRLFYDD